MLQIESIILDTIVRSMYKNAASCRYGCWNRDDDRRIHSWHVASDETVRRDNATQPVSYFWIYSRHFIKWVSYIPLKRKTIIILFTFSITHATLCPTELSITNYGIYRKNSLGLFKVLFKKVRFQVLIAISMKPAIFTLFNYLTEDTKPVRMVSFQA